MYRLCPSGFRSWFHALQESDAFPWQERLFRDWLCPSNARDARWPRLINLPTATGKTSVIDLAILALACGSPCARRRIAFVVDRRIIVDEAANRAQRIASALKEALSNADSPLRPVASALVEAGADPAEPLFVVRLRGGLDLDDSWAMNPVQPVVILSTVDQVGSRLLFRAYGATSNRSWPITAGLLGVDSLIFVDEAHCAQPFCQTLSAIESRWQHMREQEFAPGLVTVQMSATLANEADFQLNNDDFRCGALAQRLNTPKRARLEVVDPSHPRASATDDICRSELEARILTLASEWLSRCSTGVLAVVVNRVASARRIFGSLDLPSDRKLLLTGRVRAWERDQLIRSWLPRIRAGRGANDMRGPIAVIATQCIEVGADLDFDFLITEAASLDALRQRFGRLNRFGIRNRQYTDPDRQNISGVVVVHRFQLENAQDPIYSKALASTWEFLRQIAEDEVVDFSHKNLSRRMEGAESESLLQPQLSAFPLLPAYLDLLAHTSPPPEPDIEIAAFLHGCTRPSGEVTLVWRAGLRIDEPESWVDDVAIQPPLPGEGCPVPVWEARAWLAGHTDVQEVSHDLESGGAPGSQGAEGVSPSSRVALAWRGADDSVVRRPDEIRPGELLIVPCEYGGCTDFGWDPASSGPVRDIGDAVAASLGRRPALRLAALPPSEPTLEDLRNQLLKSAEEWEEFPERQSADTREFLEQTRDRAIQRELDWLSVLADSLLQDTQRQVITDSLGRPIALVGSRSRGDDTSTASDASTFRRGRRILLSTHLEGVAATARKFADTLELPALLSKSIEYAAKYHDLGKQDPRFQAWLLGLPTAPAEVIGQPLAKSPLISPRHSRAIRRARGLAGYPVGNRHEALSLAILEKAQVQAMEDADPDLVLHLVGTHHGYGRPWFPVVDDPQAPEIRVRVCDDEVSLSAAHMMHRPESGATRRFWRLVRKYGWWGLAYLEAILRLADQLRSAQEEVTKPLGEQE